MTAGWLYFYSIVATFQIGSARDSNTSGLELPYVRTHGHRINNSDVDTEDLLRDDN